MFREYLRYKDLKSAIDEFHLDDESFILNCVLVISDDYTLVYILDGLSTVEGGYLKLEKVRKGACCPL